jgi:hypothetical protein
VLLASELGGDVAIRLNVPSVFSEVTDERTAGYESVEVPHDQSNLLQPQGHGIAASSMLKRS